MVKELAYASCTSSSLSHPEGYLQKALPISLLLAQSGGGSVSPTALGCRVIPCRVKRHALELPRPGTPTSLAAPALLLIALPDLRRLPCGCLSDRI